MLDPVVAWLLAPLALLALYQGTLGALALIAFRREPPPGPRQRSFSIVVPAHDEEPTIVALLDSIAVLDYPRDRVRVHVIADNCTDHTADVARMRGAIVHERTDPDRRSKGSAIAWLLLHPAFRQERAAALVLVDADCLVSPNLLDAFDRHMEQGATIMQAWYDVRGADTSSNLRLRQIAFALVNLVRPLGKRAFGGLAGLKGTGMCFERSLLDRLGWDAHGLAEDVEQHMRYVEAGHVVRFVPEARVQGLMPVDAAASSAQHRRWEAGRMHVLRAHVGRVLARGLQRRSPAMVDAALEQLTPPLSISVAILGAAFAVGALLRWPWTFAVAASGLGALLFYVGCGVWSLRLPPREFVRAMLVAPWYLAWKLPAYIRAIAVSRRAQWVRTARDEPV